MKTDEEKAREILKKRELAAKGLEERGDGKPIDPMEDIGPFDLDVDPEHPESAEEKQEDIAANSAAAGIAVKR